VTVTTTREYSLTHWHFNAKATLKDGKFAVAELQNLSGSERVTLPDLQALDNAIEALTNLRAAIAEEVGIKVE
jgi:hypothetical protein